VRQFKTRADSGVSSLVALRQFDKNINWRRRILRVLNSKDPVSMLVAMLIFSSLGKEIADGQTLLWTITAQSDRSGCEDSPI
jgi:hypothetical protein